jgi:Holliday junction DNA helicase RuvA
MIGKLKGIIDTYGPDWVIIDVGGVGYLVHCSARTLAALPAAGEAAAVAIETYVREDVIRLFGFASSQERDWFRLLLGVQGVGTKVALAVLGTLTPNELATAIAMQDKALIARAPGIGPKVAQRVVAELKDKAPALGAVDPALAVLQGSLEAGVPTAAGDAVSALLNLGYGQAQAGAAVSTALRKAGDEASAESLIRVALKELAR